MVLCAGRSSTQVTVPLLIMTTQLKHDNNKDGYLTKDEVIQLSESLLVRSKRHPSLIAD
jgi:hypothetical protein